MICTFKSVLFSKIPLKCFLPGQVDGQFNVAYVKRIQYQRKKNQQFCKRHTTNEKKVCTKSFKYLTSATEGFYMKHQCDVR
jgi:hypothetical protein